MKFEKLDQNSKLLAARADLLAYNEFVHEHGLFADHLRQHEAMSIETPIRMTGGIPEEN